ncbi:MarR family winged helix-turn-helix transcriptional regulator [Pseudonocardia sp. N23]|uniref:MarR family winged helix-turn-helix transcriptional regulator n=1 Tax=Pseudonocardia sp. N23 TaxID=1987376 RepID=UPI000BFB3F6A|nr:MarR family transcriptional regulator [Pseudonocardia sp. N23]
MSTPVDPDPAAGPETRWLDGAELQSWLSFSGMLLTLPGFLDAQLQRDQDLSLFGYLVMAGLSDAPERTLRMSELAVLTQGSLSRLSHAVAKLERHGWVVRRPCPTNGRVTIATLTGAGVEKLAAAAPGHVAAVRRLVTDPLGPDLFAELGEASRRILDVTTGPGYPAIPRRTDAGTCGGS